jgi:hypothetical protein
MTVFNSWSFANHQMLFCRFDRKGTCMLQHKQLSEPGR